MTWPADAHSPRFTKVIAVLDVVESVRLMEQDEQSFIRRWREFVAFTQQRLAEHGGRLVKSLGDGLMLEFQDAQGCIRTAFSMQAWFHQGNQALAAGERMLLRVGAHLAEFVADEHDIYGTDVNLTARICTLAGPGEIVITAALRDRLAAGLDADVEDLGDCHLKHLKEPVRAYRVGPVGEAPVVDVPHAATTVQLRPTIAVIPFGMRSAEPGHELLGEALADEVIAALSRTSELQVISRLSTTVFRDRHEALGEIQRHLGANYILSGHARTSSDQLALFVELIEASSGHVVWADSLKGRVQGLFAPDDAVIAQLVSAVASSVIAHEVQRARGHSLPTLEGYTLLLSAIALMHRISRTDLDQAKAMLEHLIERNRRHPAAYAWLAKWHVLRAQQGWFDDPKRETQMALDCSQRALDCDPNSPLALTIDGFVRVNLMKDLEAGGARYAQALGENPNESLAWLLTGVLNAFQGNGNAALDASERALRLSPLDPMRYFYDSLAASAAVTAGAYDRAIVLARRSLKANRSHASTYRALAIAQSLSGDFVHAQDTVRQLLELEPGFSVSAFLERTPARGGMAQKIAGALSRAGLPPH